MVDDRLTDHHSFTDAVTDLPPKEEFWPKVRLGFTDGTGNLERYLVPLSPHETVEERSKLIEKFKECGATIVDISQMPRCWAGEGRSYVPPFLASNFKADIAEYLATRKAAPGQKEEELVRSVEDLIEYNKRNRVSLEARWSYVHILLS